MALYLYDADDVRLKYRVCSLDDAELEVLEPCINELHDKTGIILDAYGKTRLHQNQIDLLIKSLFNRQSPNKKKTKTDDAQMAILNKLLCFKNGLIAIGD